MEGSSWPELLLPLSEAQERLEELLFTTVFCTMRSLLCITHGGGGHREGHEQEVLSSSS